MRQSNPVALDKKILNPSLRELKNSDQSITPLLASLLLSHKDFSFRYRHIDRYSTTQVSTPGGCTGFKFKLGEKISGEGLDRLPRAYPDPSSRFFLG